MAAEIIIATASALISGVCLFVIKVKLKEIKMEKIRQQEEARKLEIALKNGLACLLRKNIMDEHDRWCKHGSITSKALECDLHMYESYKALGGNGMIDGMEEEIKELPIID